MAAGGISAADGYENNAVFGTGDVQIKAHGLVAIRGANNVAGGAKVLVADQGYGGGLVFRTDYVPTIDTNSSGTLILAMYSGANVDAALGSTTTPVG